MKTGADGDGPRHLRERLCDNIMILFICQAYRSGIFRVYVTSYILIVVAEKRRDIG